MGNILEEFVQRNSALVVTFLCNFVQSLKIIGLKNGFIDQISEKFLWFFNQLNMTIGEIYLFE